MAEGGSWLRVAKFIYHKGCNFRYDLFFDVKTKVWLSPQKQENEFVNSNVISEWVQKVIAPVQNFQKGCEIT